MNIRDSYIKEFNNYESFKSASQQLQDDSRWIETETERLIIEHLPNEPICRENYLDYFNINEYSNEEKLDLIQDTMENTQLYCWIDNERHLVRDTAVNGFLSRVGLENCRAISKATKSEGIEDVVRAHAMFKPYFAKAKALVLVRRGKVTAVHSGAESDYQVLPMGELVKTLENSLSERFPGWKFQSGAETHDKTTALFSLHGQSDTIFQKYQQALPQHVRSTIPSPVALVRFESSDTGSHAAKLWPILADGYNLNRLYPLSNSPISLAHKGKKATIEAFSECCDQIYAQLTEQAEKLAELANIEIENPLETLQNLKKRFVLPERYATMAINDFIDGLPTGSPHGQAGFTVVTRNCSQAIYCHKGHCRQDHDKEDKNP